MEKTRELYCQCFGGFYESRWLNCDSVYWEIQNIQSESGVELNNNEYEFDVDRERLFNKVGVEYVTELEDIFKAALGYEGFSMEFVEVVSPREYNFSTDKILYRLSMQDEDKFYEVVRAKMHEYYDTLKDMIKERHTSYDGFISMMSNDINDWLVEIKENDNRPYLACILEYLAEINLGDDEGAKDYDIIDCEIYEMIYDDGRIWLEDYIVGCDEESQKALQNAIDAMC